MQELDAQARAAIDALPDEIRRREGSHRYNQLVHWGLRAVGNATLMQDARRVIAGEHPFEGFKAGWEPRYERTSLAVPLRNVQRTGLFVPSHQFRLLNGKPYENLLELPNPDYHNSLSLDDWSGSARLAQWRELADRRWRIEDFLDSGSVDMIAQFSVELWDATVRTYRKKSGPGEQASPVHELGERLLQHYASIIEDARAGAQAYSIFGHTP